MRQILSFTWTITICERVCEKKKKGMTVVMRDGGVWVYPTYMQGIR